MIISIGYRVNSKRGTLFRQWANKELKEYLLKGYVINENRVVVSNENFNNLLVVVNDIKSCQININKIVETLEDKVLDKDYGINKIFYNGMFYDAYILIQSLFESANNEIIIIDNYKKICDIVLDRSILDRLIVKKKNVNVIIYTNNQTSKISTIRYTNNVHDNNAN